MGVAAVPMPKTPSSPEGAKKVLATRLDLAIAAPVPAAPSTSQSSRMRLTARSEA